MPAPVPIWPFQRTSRPSSASRARTALEHLVGAGAEPALERAEQGRQRRLDRTRLEPERAGAVAEVGREVLRPQRHVQADPDDRPPFLHARFDEHARDLAPVHEHIVGPFDRHPRPGSGHPRHGTGHPRHGTGHPRHGTGHPRHGTGHPRPEPAAATTATDDSTTSATATPATSGSNRGGSRTTIEHSSARPAGADQVLPWRPRPADCSAAVTSVPCGAPRPANSRARAFVESVSRKCARGLPSRPSTRSMAHHPRAATAPRRPATPPTSGPPAWRSRSAHANPSTRSLSSTPAWPATLTHSIS